MPEALCASLRAAGITLDEAAAERLGGYVAAVKGWNPIGSLVSEPALQRLWEDHVADSLALLPVVADSVDAGAVWWDLGSGGGFPAFPIKSVRPDLPLTCWERSEKKSGILRQMAADCRLCDVTVHAEQFSHRLAHPEGRLVITARAVEKPERLHPSIARFMRTGDVFLCQHLAAPQAFPAGVFHVEHCPDPGGGLRRGVLHRVERWA